MNQHSKKYVQQRRFLLLLPLLVLPFIFLLFWLLGGGREAKASGQVKSGLNTTLPDANLKNSSVLDKLSFYAMADRDSVKRAEQIRMDPNYQQETAKGFPQYSDTEVRSNDVMNRTISTLQRRVEEPAYVRTPKRKSFVEADSDIERMESMLQSLNAKRSDPEMDALNETLDKLLAIQKPAPAKKASATDRQTQVFAVTPKGSGMDKSFFGTASVIQVNSFLSDGTVSKDSVQSGTIAAVVHNEQTVLSGSVVKLRLLQDVFVNGQRIPEGSFLFGYSSIGNGRLKIDVPSIQFQNRLYPVALTVFDMDGLEGINIPGSAGREVFKESADQAVQSVSGMSFDPSLKAQATAAGVNTAKSLFSKKVKEIRVTVKAGYRVLLRDETEKSN